MPIVIGPDHAGAIPHDEGAERRLRAAPQPCRQWACLRTDCPVMRAESLDRTTSSQMSARATVIDGRSDTCQVVISG